MTAGFQAVLLNSVTMLNDCTCWMEFDFAMDAQPGQFVMAWLPDIGEKPFSIASMDPFSLLVVDVGPFSHAMLQLRVGDPLWIRGPLGTGFVLEGKSILLVGGGYGSAPLLPLAALAKSSGISVHVCLGARSAPGILLSDEFEQLGCEVSLATEDGSRGSEGLVTGIVEEAVDYSAFDMLYACGPTGMLSGLAGICKIHRLNYQLSWEAHMRCGMGLCGSCEVSQALDPALPSGWLACYDGPVFRKQIE
ncbi:dihydroorotate dehydrogenase electron transfer subunit [Patescibacteria group bacterium]|nr:dihydroorotate dehydrogenase electron transfer subunit [Patescibacteria group bacterium]